MSNEVYGEAGKNTFTIPNVVGFFSTTVNKETGVTQLFKQGPFLTQESIGTYDPSTGKFTRQENSSISQRDITRISNPEGLNTIRGAATQTATRGGATNANQLISRNTANPTTPGADPITGDSSGVSEEELKKEAGTTNKNTRKTYQPDVKYPLNLKSENQDCIKFSIVEYKPPGLQPGGQGSRIVTLNSSRPEIAGEGRTILGTITLPIPGGISDRNSADWQGNQIGELERALSNISADSILEGFSAGANTVGKEVGNLNPGDTTNTLVSFFAQQAAGSSNLISRKFGAVVNPNLELLFNGPTLRNFTFNFRFTPREPKEAVAVRTIIRNFKQAMSVKRSASSLLLRAPHTFAISYLSKDTDHPYLNKFKECALTDCAVNYTPDGTYMTYTDSSMTAYELSLTFQELEPIFDDDYFEIDKNQDTSIGF
jgi:hypothetical protein